jgi:ATP-dependent helicase/nuclease subunit A
VSAAQVFGFDRVDAADFGTTVHALLAEVEDGGTAAAERLAADWAQRRLPPAAVAEALACVRAPELATVWRPAVPGYVEVWRERAFEIVLDGAWVAGVFDRVVIERDADGRARRATVFDFKTTAVQDERAMATMMMRHAAQLQVYRRVAAVLAGVSDAAIGAELIFTGDARRVPVPAEHGQSVHGDSS